MRLFIIPICIIFLLAIGCKTQTNTKEVVDKTIESAGTPVTITSVINGNMNETVEVNAVSAFLLKNYVKANTTGYLMAVNTQIGKYVQKGQELFIIKTKDAQSLGNTINQLDTTLHFEGTLHIKASGSGYVTLLPYKVGDYVQDNEQLATITDTKNFVFLLDLPYELKPYLPNNKTLQLRLPDGTVLDGYINAAMPTVDVVSQTQSYIIKVNTDKAIPENLIAKVSLVKSAKTNVTSLPKAAVLTDEIQSQYWIMKMIDSATAVKILIKKGIETSDNVEIISPKLSGSDKILLTGNYGLPDTAKVSIIK